MVWHMWAAIGVILVTEGQYTSLGSKEEDEENEEVDTAKLPHHLKKQKKNSTKQQEWEYQVTLAEFQAKVKTEKSRWH